MSAAEAMSATAPIAELDAVARTFVVGDSEARVLRGITLSIGAGEYVALIGPSGSGKSTLMYQLGCLDTPTEGTIRISGVEITSLSDAELARLRNRVIGFVFQSFNLLPRTTAVDNVALPLRYAGMAMRERRALAAKALARVGLAHRAEYTPERMSGGEKQRVAIARAIVNEPSLLLCDEPTGNLDQKTGAEIVELFEALNRELGVTLVIVTHDMGLARRARRVVKLVDGAVVYDGPPSGEGLSWSTT